MNLAKSILETLDAFNITEKLFCITTDNASNNKKAMKALSKLLLKHKNIKWNWKEHHISCLNHVIDLGVQAFLKSIKVIEEEEEDEEDMIIEEEDDSDEDEDEEMEDDDVDESDSDMMISIASEFQAIMWKLREIVKIISSL